MLHEKLTSQIIKAFYQINNTPGYGFLKKFMKIPFTRIKGDGFNS